MMDAWLSLWAAPAALGFALFFNVRRRTLVAIAVLAIGAHLVREGMQSIGWELVGASFAAAFLVGAVAYVLGPLTGEASPVYAFAPVIPLIPGTLFFDGFSALGNVVVGDSSTSDSALLLSALHDMLTAAAVMLALALGTTAPGLLRPRARRRD